MKWLTIYIDYSRLFLKKAIFRVNGPMALLFHCIKGGC